jgi:putative oxidoreductase
MSGRLDQEERTPSMEPGRSAVRRTGGIIRDPRGKGFRSPRRHATLAATVQPGTPMKPETRLAQWLLASVFVVMGGYRLWRATQGVPTANSTLVFSAAELALGLALLAGWRLRAMALLGAALMLVDALLSHRFWALSGGAQAAQLLHFMKNLGLVGGMLLLSSMATGGRRR